MTTVVDLTADEIAELKALTSETETPAAVRKAMIEYLRYARRQRLKTLSGRVEMQDNWEKLESLEPRPADDTPGSGPR
jgi:hypothetical protein